MITNTHIVFSRFIYDYCLKQLDFKLDKTLFMYGNIKPDIFPSGADSSHTIRCNKLNVEESVERLIHHELDLKHFSLQLGVLCHYICDFFCVYHNDKYKNKSLVEHIKYEFQLHFKLRQLLAEGKFNPALKASVPQSDIWAEISRIQESYHQEIDTVIKDLNYAVTAAMSIAGSIIYYSVQYNRPEKTADLQRILVPAK